MPSEIEKLHQEIRNCKACSLHTAIKNKVIGKGSKTPEVLFIGEAPGQEEDEQGKPFVGRSGKLLDKIISELDIQNYAVINAVKCRPPNNREPSEEELKACKNFFSEQIRLLGPKKIISLGKTALAQLELPSDTIINRVGTIEQSEFGSVLILPHPAYLLRNPDFILPKDRMLAFINDKPANNKILLEKFEQNLQEAENASKFEMISTELASLHYFCKLSGTAFVDSNQKDLCKIDSKLTYIKRFEQTNEIDLFENSLISQHKNVQLFLFYVIEKGNIIWLGWVDRQQVDSLPMAWHFKAEKNCKKIMYDTLQSMSALLKIYREKSEEEKIEPQPFVHLHTHTEYSIGDGYGSPKQIAEALYRKGFSACAITDHGTLAGTIYFQKALLEKNIKPIFGYEAYVLLEDKKDSDSCHLTVLVKDKIGWNNLNKIHDRAVRETFYYKPRVFVGDLLAHKEGLMVLSGCTSGLIATQVLNNQPDKAEELLVMLKEAFGDDFYAELMPNRLEIQKKHNQFMFNMIKKYGLKSVITSDSHYPNKEQIIFHKAVKAVSLRKRFDEAGFGDDTFYLLNAVEIKDLMLNNHPDITDKLISDSFANTIEIRDKCNFQISPEKRMVLPCLYDNPEEKLKELTIAGLEKHTPYKYEQVKDRINLEISRFVDKHYENYFLIVEDYVRWCKNNDIMVGPGRGSVGGSLAAYALNITEVDPLQYNLLFDRFISEIRKDAPDIDLDFEDSKRERLINYFKEKYGENNFAKIITYSLWHAKGVMRDIGRIFNIPASEINKICKLVVQRSGGDARASFCLLDTFTEFEQAKEFYKKYKMQCDIAVGLESHIRHRGVHAAGVTITNQPVSELVPIEKVGGEIVTAWEKKEIESVGLIKFDILGLKTLSVISDALSLIKSNCSKQVELPRAFDDSNVYEKVFKPGKCSGVFQFETSGLSKLSRQLAIDKFNILYDATCLYRPGPLRSGESADYVLRHTGKKQWAYDHPLLEPITKDTYGLILYQEQVMQVMFDLGKFSWATAESARKIMTKSQGKDAFNKMRKEFCENAKREHRIAEDESGKIFDVVSTFGSYGFNKSHGVEYSIISFWTAWLKTYYPAEFFLSLLRKESTAEKISEYIQEAKDFAGIKVLTPRLNLSKIEFTTDGKNIIAGFTGIKGVAEKGAKKIIANQPYTSIHDFIARAKPSPTLFKALTCSGVFDEFYSNRKYLFNNAEAIIKHGFMPPEKLLNTEDIDLGVWSDKEREMKMAEYLDLPSETPLIDLYDNPFKDKINFEKIGLLNFDEPSPERWIKGIVTFINFKQEGLEGQWTMFDNVLERRYAHLNVNDGTGNVLVHLSPEQYTYYKRYLERGAGFPVIIKGHSIKNFNKIYCDAMIVLDDINYDLPIIKYISGRNSELDALKKSNGGSKYGIIQSVNYKVSKNKHPYARIFFTDGSTGMIFKLTSDIFAAGEILEFKLQDPFITVLRRIK